MGQISLSIPLSGQPNSTEDPKIASDLTTLQNVINGNIDPTNLNPTSGITRLARRVAGANISAAAGDWIYAAPSITVTLPAPALNAIVAVTTQSSVSGANAVTVSGTNIYGDFTAVPQTSFVLGYGTTTAILQSDGTNWIFISGQQDTGWLSITPGTNVAGSGAGQYIASARLQGGTVRLKGLLTNNTGGTVSNYTMGTVAASVRPSQSLYVPVSYGGTAGMAVVTTSGQINLFSLALTNGAGLGLDGATYTLS